MRLSQMKPTDLPYFKAEVTEDVVRLYFYPQFADTKTMKAWGDGNPIFAVIELPRCYDRKPEGKQ